LILSIKNANLSLSALAGVEAKREDA